MQNDLKILSIETSCDDTSFCLMRQSNQRVLIDYHQSFNQDQVLKLWGGIVPEIAARNHAQKIKPLLHHSFENVDYSMEDIDLIAVTTTPGLLGPLLTGVNTAKSLSLIYQKPIYCANHLHAHLEAIHLSENIDYPYLGLLISGGHSLFIEVKAKNDFHVIAGTIDDAAGEAFDKGGKMMGLGYPAGRTIDQLASFGDAKKIDFPIGLKASADARMSFSGLKTALRVYLDKRDNKLFIPDNYTDKDSRAQELYDICASYQHAIARALKLKLKYALKQTSASKIVVGGGVACNSHIREVLKNNFSQVYFVKSEFCTDNAAMIANLARINNDQSIGFPESLKIDAKSRSIQKTKV